MFTFYVIFPGVAQASYVNYMKFNVNIFNGMNYAQQRMLIGSENNK